MVFSSCGKIDRFDAHNCARSNPILGARLHQASVLILRQLCNDTSDSVLIEINGLTQIWVATPFWSNSIDFNENSIPSIIAELSQCQR